MRRIRVLCENGGGTVSLAKGTANGIIGCNNSHNASDPTEKDARSANVPSPDVGWGPEALFSMSNWLRLIIGFERVDPNIEACS